MEIKFAIIHELRKEQHSSDVGLELRPAVLNISPTLERLMRQVMSTYKHKTARSYGKFANSDNEHNFESLLNEFADEKTVESFVRFTKQSMYILQSKIEQVPFAKGGYILIVNYNDGENKEYLFVLKINDVEGTAIERETLELKDSLHLEVDKLHLGARLSMTEWLNDEDISYLSFIRGRSNRNPVSLYFRDFLGCEDLSTAREDSRKLVEAIKNYSQNFDLDEGARVRAEAFRFCEVKRKNREDIYLEELSRIINPEYPDAFLEFANGDDFRVSPTSAGKKRTRQFLAGLPKNWHNVAFTSF